MLAHLFLTSLSLLLSGQLTQAQPQPSDDIKATSDDPISKKEVEAQRTERRERWRRYRNAAPQQRRMMRTERMVDMASRTYELDEMQKEIVRSEIESIQQDRRLAMGEKVADYDKLRDEMRQYWTRRREQAGEEAERRSFWRQAREDPQFMRLREQLREIESEYPFNWQQSLKRIEALLPIDQAEKGRKRLQERINRRSASWGRRRREAFRERNVPEESKSLKLKEKTGNRASEDRQTSQGTDANKNDRSNERTRANEASPKPPLHPWEKYVQEFIGKHKLNPPQTAAALSILKDELTRARQIERSIANEIDKAKQLKDQLKKEKRLTALNQPIEQLFNELKRRLDGLLTASQRTQKEKAGI